MTNLQRYNIPSNAIISVAGTVGVGKSTLTTALSEYLGFQASYENVNENPYLEKFYTDLKRWSFQLQIFFLGERLKEHHRIVNEGGGFVIDRSLHEDKDLFCQMLHEQGNMSDEDYETYSGLYEAMVTGNAQFPKYDLIIYLDGPLEEILKRIALRGRPMEQQTAIEYWADLHRRYTEWIEQFTFCPVLRISLDEFDLNDKEASLDRICRKIEAKLAEQQEILV